MLTSGGRYNPGQYRHGVLVANWNEDKFGLEIVNKPVEPVNVVSSIFQWKNSFFFPSYRSLLSSFLSFFQKQIYTSETKSSFTSTILLRFAPIISFVLTSLFFPEPSAEALNESIDAQYDPSRTHQGFLLFLLLLSLCCCFLIVYPLSRG
jgi:hypothetical protein